MSTATTVDVLGTARDRVDGRLKITCFAPEQRGPSRAASRRSDTSQRTFRRGPRRSGLGTIRVARVVSAVDGGRILNSKTARRQIIGGIAMGISMALLEQTVSDRNGREHVVRRLCRRGERGRAGCRCAVSGQPDSMTPLGTRVSGNSPLPGWRSRSPVRQPPGVSFERIGGVLFVRFFTAVGNALREFLEGGTELGEEQRKRGGARHVRRRKREAAHHAGQVSA
jgi:hypothetical protein